MKFLRPTVKKVQKTGRSVSTHKSVATPTPPMSFGERRAQEIQRRMDAARTERNKLVRAAFATKGTAAHKAILTKRAQVDGTISRLASQQKSND